LFIAVGLATGVAGGLAGCGFQPLYGTTASGARLSEVMAGVDITPIPGRLGQRIRNELIFENTGGGYAAPTKYTLDITVKESITDQLVTTEGEATGQVYQVVATFKLRKAGNKEVVLQGKAISRAAYDRFQQIFANVRARYDAQDRVARTIAETIMVRLAAYLSNAA
jgi:LPS-assembly lipoprotein